MRPFWVPLIADPPRSVCCGVTTPGVEEMPADDLKGLVMWLKADPGQASAGNAGIGSSTYVASIFFQMQTGTRFQLVPYRGGAPAMQDLLAGQIDMLFDLVANALPQVRAGTVKPYAVTAQSRTAVASRAIS